MRKEIPILFSGPMAQATLALRKTQTRRTRGLDKINTHPDEWAPSVLIVDEHGVLKVHFDNAKRQISVAVKCPYGKPGALLYVRETWKPRVFAGTPVGGYDYKADLPADAHKRYGLEHGPNGWEKWRPSIHMPKAAARIWLEVESVRVERLQEISEEDAVAEGIACITKDGSLFKYGIPAADGLPAAYDEAGWVWAEWQPTARDAFRKLFISINGPEVWIDNKWVWVVTFRVISTTGRPA